MLEAQTANDQALQRQVLCEHGRNRRDGLANLDVAARLAPHIQENIPRIGYIGRSIK
jgi:hypothetical protein